MAIDLLIALRAGGVSLVLDIENGGLPVVRHWGPDLGELSATDALAMRRAQAMPPMPNATDEPVRIAIVPEEHTGWTGQPGLQGSRTGRDWSPVFTVTDVTVNGAPASRLVQLGGAAIVQTLARDDDAGLELQIDIELTAQGLVRVRAGVRNLRAEPYQVTELVVALPVPAQAREVLDFAGRWGKERQPQRRQLTVGQHRRENRSGRTGADSAYQLIAGVPGFGYRQGDCWAIHTAWSGNHLHYAERTRTGVQLIGGGELLLPGEIILGAGEQYWSPWLFASFGAGLDASARRYHDWLRARPNHPRSPRPVTLNVWEAVYFDHEISKLLELVELAAQIGVERFVLDDGWFGDRRSDQAGLGDWQVSPEVWPDGLHPLTDAVARAGMQFGLWVEPEMVNLDSELARAHPDWIMATGARLPVESRHQQVLDLTNPDAYAHVRDQLAALLAEYDIGYLKWDHNRDLASAGSPANSGRPAVHAQTLAAYRLMAELKQLQPGLEIESCSSGGARVDLAVLEYTDRVWASDCMDAVERQEIDWWTKQLVPPELVGSHIAAVPSHTTGRVQQLPMRAATAVFGHLGIEWDITAASELELAMLGGWIAWYQANRELLHSGAVVRLDWPDDELRVHGVVGADRAIYAIAFVAMTGPENLGLIPLPGLDATARYRVQVVFVDQVRQFPEPWQTGPIELTGAQLGSGVLRAPVMFTDQVVVVEVDRIRANDG